MTQPDLAAKVGVGLSTLRQIERGAPNVQAGFYVTALWALDLLDELLDAASVLGRSSSIGILLEQAAGARARDGESP